MTAQRFRISLVAVMTATLLAGCAGAPGPTETAEPTAAAPAPRCMPAGNAAEIFFADADGTTLAGVEAGVGPAGLVLVHGSGNAGRCVWTREIPTLVEAGFHILAIDHACVGASECPDDKDAVADIGAAVAELERLGAESVGVIGASAGTAETIVAAAQLDLAAVVALSPMRFDVDVALTDPMTVDAAAPVIGAPTLLVIGTDDRNASVDATTALAAAIPAERATLLVVDGGGHAQELLYPEGATADSTPAGPTYDAVVAYLLERLT